MYFAFACIGHPLLMEWSLFLPTLSFELLEVHLIKETLTEQSFLHFSFLEKKKIPNKFHVHYQIYIIILLGVTCNHFNAFPCGINKCVVTNG